jgi:hypothetical protein
MDASYPSRAGAGAGTGGLADGEWQYLAQMSMVCIIVCSTSDDQSHPAQSSLDTGRQNHRDRTIRDRATPSSQ